jgi:hypothetical protein
LEAPAFRLKLYGVPSKLAQSGARPVTGLVAFWKKSRLAVAASAQNLRSAAGPHCAYNS